MRIVWLGCVLVAFTAAAPPAQAQLDGVNVRGARVTLEVGSGRRTRLSGELLAVSPDSLWLLGDSGLVGLLLSHVGSASLKRHSADARMGLVWTLVGGLVTGGALTAACASVSDGCASVFAGTMITWGIVGAISALSMEISSRSVFRTPRIGEQLRGYARFPQGLPPHLDRRTFGQQVELRARIMLPFR